MNEQEFYSELVSKMADTDRKNNLAFGAVAETLTQLNGYFQKQELEEEEKEKEMVRELEKQQSEESKSTLIKEISTAVFEVLKAENMQLNANQVRNVKHKDIFYSGGGDEDKQVDANATNDTSEVQKPIQAMIKSEVANIMKHFLKEHEALYTGDDVKEDVMSEEAEEGMEMEPEMEMDDMGHDDDMGGEDFESAEYPMEEDDYEKMYKSLKKDFVRLRKATNPQRNIENAARKMSENTLQKQGWNKEVSRQPRRITENTLGLDDTVLQKSANTGDVTEQLSNMSWRELTLLRAQRDSGNHDGLPREIIGG